MLENVPLIPAASQSITDSSSVPPAWPSVQRLHRVPENGLSLPFQPCSPSLGADDNSTAGQRALKVFLQAGLLLSSSYRKVKSCNIQRMCVLGASVLLDLIVQFAH